MSQLIKSIGERVRYLRKAQNLSQELLAEQAGLHHNYIGQVERGEKNLTIETIEKIARGLNVHASEIFRYILTDEKNGPIEELSTLLSNRSDEDQRLILTLAKSIFNWSEK